MENLLPAVSGKKTSGSTLLETLLQWLSTDQGIKAIIVVAALGVLFLFVRWVISRSSSLYEEHDQLRKSLAEDRQILRDEVRHLLEELEISRGKLLEQDRQIRSLRDRVSLLRHKLMEFGFDFSTIDVKPEELR